MMASLTRSHSAKSSSLSVGFKRPRVSAFCSAVICPFSANLPSDFSMDARPFFSSSSDTSRTTTGKPAAAATWAIPEPIRPQPTTPTLRISIAIRSLTCHLAIRLASTRVPFLRQFLKAKRNEGPVDSRRLALILAGQASEKRRPRAHRDSGQTHPLQLPAASYLEFGAVGPVSIETILQTLPDVRPPQPEDSAAQGLLPFPGRFWRRPPSALQAHRDPLKLPAMPPPKALPRGNPPPLDLEGEPDPAIGVVELNAGAWEDSRVLPLESKAHSRFVFGDLIITLA